MKNNNFDSVFGNSDTGFKELIESQANTEERIDVKEDKHNVKTFIKTRNLKIKKNIRKNN